MNREICTKLLAELTRELEAGIEAAEKAEDPDNYVVAAERKLTQLGVSLRRFEYERKKGVNKCQRNENT